jgi:hypothetical protein
MLVFNYANTNQNHFALSYSIRCVEGWYLSPVGKTDIARHMYTAV